MLQLQCDLFLKHLDITNNYLNDNIIYVDLIMDNCLYLSCLFLILN